MERTVEILSKCKEWAIKNNLQLANENIQLKKIAEELTEAFIHLSYGQSIDDDIGDILIATNTYLLIESYHYGEEAVNLSIESFAKHLVEAYNDNQELISKDEWRDDYFLPLVAELYDDKKLSKSWLITTVIKLIRSFSETRYPAGYIEQAYNEIKNRKYTSSFDKE